MPSTDSGATRRRLLRAAAGGAATFAGCAGSDDGSSPPRSDDSTEWPSPAFDPQATAYAPDGEVVAVTGGGEESEPRTYVPDPA